MLRIVGVQRGDVPAGEIVLLQNQGSIRVQLRGHVVLSEATFDGNGRDNAFHAFGDDVFVPPGVYVALCTGKGQSRWGRSKDGTTVYYAFMGRDEAVWNSTDGPIHVLATQHSYEDSREALLVQ